MEFEDENEIRSLISGPPQCVYRAVLKRVYGYDIPGNCPIRSILKAAFERDQGAEKTAKYKLEYPD